MIERRGMIRGIQRSALYSDDDGGPDGFGAYRFLLVIVWSERNPRRMLSAGLNPSTATHLKNDPTLTRECRFAADMGFGGLLKVNLAAIRATDPREMLAHPDPIGAENTPEWMAALQADLVVATWGAHGAHLRLADQARAVRAVFGARLHAYGLCANGMPTHPLYLPASARPRLLSELERAA